MIVIDNFVSVNNLIKAAYELSTSDRKLVGTDGMTVKELHKLLKNTDLAKHTVNSILSGSYKPNPLIEKQIPKKGTGKMRIIYIPCVLDKAIQRMIGSALSNVTETVFHNWSFGYRPGKSIQNAILQASGFMKEGYTKMILVDLRDFYGNIDLERLRKYLREDYRIDEGTRKLINAFITAKIIGQDSYSESKGIPAGIPLAPVLANIYLSSLDRKLSKGGIKFIRFADDITLFFKTEVECHLFHKEILKAWEPKYAVCINVQKTHLGIEGNRSLLGFELDDFGRIRVSATMIDAFCLSLVDLLSSRSFLNCKNRQTLRDKVRSKVSSFLFMYRIAENFDEIQLEINKTLEHIRFVLAETADSLTICSISKIAMKIDECEEYFFRALHDVIPLTNELKITKKIKSQNFVKKKEQP